MIDTNKEYITCSAIWFDDKIKHEHQPKNIESGYVICGHRHHNCFTTASILQPSLEYVRNEKVQGFLTNTDRFVDREEGAKIASSAEQVQAQDKFNINRLYSEDIY